MIRFLSILWVGLVLLAPLSVHAKVKVFACEPEWASLAQEVGGQYVNVFSATHAKQDPHHIRARPSLIAKARHADIFFCSGAGLEEGWLPILLQKAGRNVQPGELGYLMAAELLDLLEKPAIIDRKMGHIHAEGNPHIHLNPYHILKIGEVLTKRLSEIDPEHQTAYQQQYTAFAARWKKAITTWEKAIKPLEGAKIIVHHKSFTYLLDWLKLKEVGTLEPKPGVPTTTKHLEHLLQTSQTQKIDMILLTPYDDQDGSKWLSKKTDTPIVILPYTVGGDDKSKSLFNLFDQTIALMRAAYDQP